MNALGIGDVSIGYSKTGITEFVNELNSKAISETADLLHQTDSLVQALQAGWQGQSEMTFEKNFEKAVEEAAEALNELKTGMESEFDNVASAFNDFDNKLVNEE
jgi:uncharacterized protein YukE